MKYRARRMELAPPRRGTVGCRTARRIVRRRQRKAGRIDTACRASRQRGDASGCAAGGRRPRGGAWRSAARSRSNRIRQVVVFGDSLSDVGTYRVGGIAAVGGGKFTTNPGPVWPETIGLLFGTRVTPFRQGFGPGESTGARRHRLRDGRLARVAAAGHQLFSACDRRVHAGADDPGHAADHDYLDFPANGGRFTRNQLVFVFAGGNDVIFQLQELGKGQRDGPAGAGRGAAGRTRLGRTGASHSRQRRDACCGDDPARHCRLDSRPRRGAIDAGPDDGHDADVQRHARRRAQRHTGEADRRACAQQGRERAPGQILHHRAQRPGVRCGEDLRDHRRGR